MEALVGPVPDGWTQAALGRVCELQVGPSGASVQSADPAGTGVPVVSPRNLQHGRIVDHDLARIPAERAQKLARYRLREGDLLWVRAGELGLRARVTRDQAGWLFASGLVRLRPTNAVQSQYLAYYLALPAVRAWVDRHGTGTAVSVISARTLGSLPVALPPLGTQLAIGEMLGTLDQQVETYRQLSQRAAALRDELAPLLIAGVLAPEQPADSPSEQHGQALSSRRRGAI